MDETDAELTQKAIQEIMNEMQQYKERQERPQERKKNPLGRTNKQFLGRTLNAMVRHNKRAVEETRLKCNKKLKELDERQYENYRKKRNNSYSSNNRNEPKSRRPLRHYSDSSDTEDSSKHKRKEKKSKMKKKKKRLERSRSNSTFSNNDQPAQQIINNDYNYNNNNNGKDIDHSAYLMAPSLWDVQMQQFYQCKALMSLGAAFSQAAPSSNTLQIVELQSSSSSLSDIKWNDSTSSSEDNSPMLTINVSDSEEGNDDSKKVPKKSTKFLDVKNSAIEISDSDCASVNSVSSVESTDIAIDLTED